jgi:hypothetical protein
MGIVLIFFIFYLIKVLFEKELQYQKKADLRDSDNSARLSGLALLIVAVIGFSFYFILNLPYWSVEQSDSLCFLFGFLGLLVILPALAVSLIAAIVSWMQGWTCPPRKRYSKGIACIGFLIPFITLLSIIKFLWKVF